MESAESALARMLKDLDALLPRSTNTAKIEVNAGSLGVWACVTACIAMLVLNIALLVMLVNHDRKIDDLSHYLNAIYMAAPHLKPPEKK